MKKHSNARRSNADVISKLAIVEDEVDEAMHWLALLVDRNLVAADELQEPRKETNELVAMTVALIKTLRSLSR